VDTFTAIESRRSNGRLTEPAPSPDDLRRILHAATLAPDHESLRPWKFMVLQGEAKVAFGKVLAQAYEARCADRGIEAHPAKREKELTKLGRAPLVVVAAAVRRSTDKVPFEEQFASAAAAVQNLLLAATALGYGSMWRTGDPAYDPMVKDALGLAPNDAIVGFIYLGTPLADGRPPADRPPAGLDQLMTHWEP
jgi:nitroreductase